MSRLATKLFEENTSNEENYGSLIAAVLGNRVNVIESPELVEDVNDILFDLCESNPFGSLQMYFLREYFLCGKAREEIGTEITKNINLLLADLESSSLRFLRHPAQSKRLVQHIRKVEK